MAKGTIHNHLPGRLNLLSLLDVDLHEWAGLVHLLPRRNRFFRHKGTGLTGPPTELEAMVVWSVGSAG
jgi:hypothetical protein